MNVSATNDSPYTLQTKRIRLGHSDLVVSRLALGTDPLGGHAWGQVDEKEALGAVAIAADYGINFYDTADCYGLGEAERRLGAALVGRRDCVVASKFGVRPQASGCATIFDNSPDWLEYSLEGSLRRLRRDCIDLYQIHYWDRTRPLRDTFDQLERKRREGKIRWYGVSNTTIGDIGPGPIPDGLVTATFEVSLVERFWEKEIESLGQKLGLTTLSWGSLGQGILSGRYTGNNRPVEGDRRSRPAYGKFHGERLERVHVLVDAMRRVQSHYPERTLSQIALRWLLDRWPEIVALVGVKTRAQTEDNSSILHWSLQPEHVVELDHISRSLEHTYDRL